MRVVKKRVKLVRERRERFLIEEELVVVAAAAADYWYRESGAGTADGAERSVNACVKGKKERKSWGEGALLCWGFGAKD